MMVMESGDKHHGSHDFEEFHRLSNSGPGTGNTFILEVFGPRKQSDFDFPLAVSPDQYRGTYSNLQKDDKLK